MKLIHLKDCLTRYLIGLRNRGLANIKGPKGFTALGWNGVINKKDLNIVRRWVFPTI